MKKPQYGYFPLSEFENRIGRLRKVMNENGMDAILVSNQADIVYFTGSLNGYWQSAQHDDSQLALIPAEPTSEPVLFVPDHLYDTAQTSCITDMRCWSQFRTSKSKGPIEIITEAFEDTKLAKGRIGMEIGSHSRPGMSPKFIEELRAAIPKAQWVENYEAIQEVQMIKSALELEKIRQACKVTCDALEIAKDAMKIGMSEKEIAHLIVSEMVKSSPDAAVNRPWTIYVHSNGRKPCAFDGVPSNYRFKDGEYMYFDGGFIYQGYKCDMIRCAAFGKPSKEIVKYYYASRDANMATIEHIKPGISVKELYQFWYDTACKMGFERSVKKQLEVDFDFLGHGIGSTIHELPILNSFCETVLEPGMVLAVEGNVFDTFPFTETKYALKNEENVIVTENGHEWLTKVNNDLWIVEDRVS